MACMMFGMTVPGYAEEDSAKVVFGSPSQYSNIDWVWISSNEKIEKMGGRDALHLSPQGDWYCRLAISDEWLYAPEGTAVEVDVEYYDKEESHFAIVYDSINGREDGGAESETVKMTGTGEWKKYTFYFDDMRAINSVEGYDIRIGVYSDAAGTSAGDIYIGSVEVRKVFPREPVRVNVTSPYYGNIFGGAEEKKFDVSFENLVDDNLDTTVTYNIVDEAGQIIKEGVINRTPDMVAETVQLDFSDITKYGLYEFNITTTVDFELNGEKKQAVSEKCIEFSVINKSDINERNQNQNVCTHGARGLWPAEPTLDIAAWAGFGGVRDEIMWENIETSKGQYAMPEAQQNFIDGLRERNLKMLYIAAGANPLYGLSWKQWFLQLPNTEEAINGYANYCGWFAEEYADVLQGIEIWNEPNTEAGDWSMLGGERYADVQIAAYNAIKKVNPNIPVVGFGATGDYIEYAEQAYQKESFKYADALASHPYNWDGNAFIPEDYVARFDKTKEFDEKYGSTTPYWFTEFGQTTAQGSGKPFEGTERIQMQTAIKHYVVVTGENLAEKTYWYDLISDNVGTDDTEANFGLVKSAKEKENPFAAKPAYVALAGLNKFLGNAEFVGSIKKEKEYYAYRFRKNGEDIAVLWANDGKEQSIGLNLGTNEVEVYDKYTNSDGKISGTDGVFSLGIGTDPIYIKGNFANFAWAEPIVSQSVMLANVMPNDTFNVELTDAYARNLRVSTGEVLGVETNVENVNEGSKTVSFKTEDELPATLFPKVEAYDGDKRVYVSFTELRIVEPISMDMKISQIEESNPDQMQVEVTVENNSYTEAITGTCQIVDIDGEEYLSKPIPFQNLKPDESITLFLNLGTMTKRRNMDITVHTTLDYGYEQSCTKKVDFTSAQYTEVKPVIDGKINNGEWTGAWLTADQKSRIKEISQWGGKEDLSFDCNLMWDEKNLYIAVNVTDNIFYQDRTAADAWAGDSFQFAIEDKLHNGNYMLAGGGVDTDFSEFCASLVNGVPTLYRNSSQHQVCEPGIVENVEIAIKRDGTHTVYEMAVPWTEMFGADYQFDSSKIFGYSMLVNDNDGNGRRGWIEYNDGIGSIKDGQLFGKMSLLKNE